MVNKENSKLKLSKFFIQQLWTTIYSEVEAEIIMEQIIAIKMIINENGPILDKKDIEVVTSHILTVIGESGNRKKSIVVQQGQSGLDPNEKMILSRDISIEG